MNGCMWEKEMKEKKKAKEIEGFELIFDIHKLYYQKSQGFHNYQSQNHFTNLAIIMSKYGTFYAFICIRE